MPSYVDSYGIEIFYDLYEPEGEPRGIVQIVHGVSEHAGRYTALADALTADGWVVYADDHRGHGRTGIGQWGTLAKRRRLGPGGHRAAEDAVWQLTQIARAAHPRVPLVIIGHSWGSFLTQMLVNDHSSAFDGAVLIGSAYRVPGSLNTGDLNAPWKGPHSRGNEWISEDPAVRQAAHDDPLTTQMPLAQAFGLANAARLFGRPARGLRDLPILLQVGRDDTVGGPRSVERLAAAYRTRSGLSDVTTRVYDGRHEILNDPVQDRVRADILAWLDERWGR
ncbi:alpha/beta fold hydrolase [Microbacterium indicum]|uniref:alpha/beta fold hydrolase n=1 Tax=Microbacterium indicum TaxID=358100 RepID=UPI0004273EC1|nr:alpha/beta fold hydrolase [Microbacterium indicum]